MTAFSKILFSGSTNGELIPVTQTATAGDTIHVTGATNLDEIWIWANNTSAAAVTLTIEWAGTGVANNIVVTLPAYQSDLIIPGLVLMGTKTVAVFASAANVVNIFGFVNRITT